MKKPFTKKDLYQEVTDKIIELLETDLPNWKQSWNSGTKGNMNLDIFDGRNGLTGKSYQGVNRLLLAKAMICLNYKSNTWFTYKQAQEVGLQVRKGENAVNLTYYNFKERKNDDGDIEQIPFLNSFYVFNVEQLDGDISKYISESENTVLTTHETNPIAQSIFAKTDVSIRHCGNKAFYSITHDFIALPHPQDFHTVNDYYATLWHELIHSTGAKHRLNREYGKKFGTTAYAREELVAELGASFLCAEIGCIHESLESHASYLKSWLEVLKADKKAIFKAASDAQKAVNYIKEHWTATENEQELKVA